MPECGPPGNLLLVYILSLLPVMEGRYAIATAVAMGVSPACALAAASLGVATLSILLPRMLPLADRLAHALQARRVPMLGRLAGLYLRYRERARRRAQRYVDTYGLPGLILFVAVPLPATGIWTGAIAAHVLGMSKHRMTIGLLTGGLISNVLIAGLAHLT